MKSFICLSKLCFVLSCSLNMVLPPETLAQSYKPDRNVPTILQDSPLHGEWALRFYNPFMVSAFNAKGSTESGFHLLINGLDRKNITGKALWNSGAGADDGPVIAEAKLTGEVDEAQVQIDILSSHDKGALLSLSGTLDKTTGFISGKARRGSAAVTSLSSLPHSGLFYLTPLANEDLQSNRDREWYEAVNNWNRPGHTQLGNRLSGSWMVWAALDKRGSPTYAYSERFFPEKFTGNWRFLGDREGGFFLKVDNETPRRIFFNSYPNSAHVKVQYTDFLSRNLASGRNLHSITGRLVQSLDRVWVRQEVLDLYFQGDRRFVGSCFYRKISLNGDQEWDGFVSYKLVGQKLPN